MENESTEPAKQVKIPSDSRVVGVSVRGWLAIMVIATVCGCALFGVDIQEVLKSIALVIIGFYYGQKGKASE